MIKLDYSENIKAPVERVFAYVTDFHTSAEWQDGVMESSQRPEAPTQLGTKMKIVRILMGQRLETAGEVTEFDPNRRFAFKTGSGPIKFNLVQAFMPAAGGTKMDTHVEMEAGGFMKVSEPVIAADLKQQLQGEGKKLKEILES